MDSGGSVGTEDRRWVAGPACGPASAPGRVCRPVLLTAILAAVAFCFGIEGRRLRKASEGRVARVAQEMLETGDWVVPRLNGAVRLEKPPASSWPVALTARLFGGGIVSTRDALLPAALSGVALASLLCLWLARLPGPASGPGDDARRAVSGAGVAAGVLAALAMVTMPGFLLQARSAEMDIHVALFAALAFHGLERYRLEGWRPGLPLTYAALGAGFLIKAHIVLLVFLPPAMAWLLLERLMLKRAGAGGAADLPAATEARKETDVPAGANAGAKTGVASRAYVPGKVDGPRPAAGGWMLHLAGAALMAAIVLPWGVPFLMRSGIGWDTFVREGLDRFEEGGGHWEPFYYYLLGVPGWAFPWTILLPFAAWAHFGLPRIGAASSRRRLWWMWFAVNLAIWSAIGAKQRHYAVPWLTPLCLIVGDAGAAILAERRASVARGKNPPLWAVWGWRALNAVGVVSAASLLMAAVFLPREGRPEGWIWGLAACSAGAFLAGSFSLARYARPLVVAGGGMSNGGGSGSEGGEAASGGARRGPAAGEAGPGEGAGGASTGADGMEERPEPGGEAGVTCGSPGGTPGASGLTGAPGGDVPGGGGYFAFRSWWAGTLLAIVLYAGTLERREDLRDSPVLFCGSVIGALPPRCELYEAGILRPLMLFYLGRNAVPVVPGEKLEAVEGTREEKRAARTRMLADAAARILAEKGPDAWMLISGDVLRLLDPSLYGGKTILGDPHVEPSRGGAFLIRGARNLLSFPRARGGLPTDR
ncbi:MAG: hypothetical protein N3A38_01320 [Planctomycetota bacterium]|nr:hypothetical protein [Planctomycetota bacterium]